MKAHVFWLFGHSGAGKSTLAKSLAAALRESGNPVLELDGDVLRSGLCKGLGFAHDARTENLRRAAETAALGIRSSITVVAGFITPTEEHRSLVTGILSSSPISWVYVDAPVGLCQKRDPKGLYAAVRNGAISQMTGMDSPFEIPLRCDLRIDTENNSIEVCSRTLMTFAKQRLGVIE